MNKLRVVVVALSLALLSVSSSYAIFGAGLHWGYDLSLSMDDVKDEKVEGFSIPSELSAVVGDVDLFRVSRSNWKNSAINFGGKVFIDFLPIINTLELSANFGLWQYDGVLSYLDPVESVSALSPVYVDIPMTLDGTGLKYIGLGGTPYAKLHFDASVRKTVFKLPLDIFKLSAGAGVSAHFATPLLTGKFVEDVFDAGDLLDPLFFVNLATPGSKENQKILNKIIDEAMGKPVFGIHIVAGASVKLPMIPLGVYIDGKYMIPISKFDENKKSISGFGLLINTGIMLSI